MRFTSLKNKKGAAMAMVLIIAMVLLLLCAAVMLAARHNMSATGEELETRQANLMAKAGVEYTKAILGEKLSQFDFDPLTGEITSAEKLNPFSAQNRVDGSFSTDVNDRNLDYDNPVLVSCTPVRTPPTEQANRYRFDVTITATAVYHNRSASLQYTVTCYSKQYTLEEGGPGGGGSGGSSEEELAGVPGYGDFLVVNRLYGKRSLFTPVTVGNYVDEDGTVYENANLTAYRFDKGGSSSNQSDFPVVLKANEFYKCHADNDAYRLSAPAIYQTVPILLDYEGTAGFYGETTNLTLQSDFIYFGEDVATNMWGAAPGTMSGSASTLFLDSRRYVYVTPNTPGNYVIVYFKEGVQFKMNNQVVFTVVPAGQAPVENQISEGFYYVKNSNAHAVDLMFNGTRSQQVSVTLDNGEQVTVNEALPSFDSSVFIPLDAGSAKDIMAAYQTAIAYVEQNKNDFQSADLDGAVWTIMGTIDQNILPVPQEGKTVYMYLNNDNFYSHQFTYTAKSIVLQYGKADRPLTVKSAASMTLNVDSIVFRSVRDTEEPTFQGQGSGSELIVTSPSADYVYCWFPEDMTFAQRAGNKGTLVPAGYYKIPNGTNLLLVTEWGDYEAGAGPKPGETLPPSAEEGNYR